MSITKNSVLAVLTALLILLSVLAIAAGDSSSSLVINEFMADNDAAVGGPYMTFPDWIELYNSGSASVDLSGMYLTEDLSSISWQFPNGTVVAPGSFLLVWGNRGSGAGMLHTNFSPNANGGTLTLLSTDGVSIIDQISFGKQLRDVSYGRLPDGSSTWSYILNPTAGEANMENPRTGVSSDWPVWVFIALSLAVCVLIVLSGRVRGRRKNDG